MKYDFIIFLFCYMVYIWSILSICERYLDKININNIAFTVILFSTGLFINAFSVWAAIPYIFSCLFHHILFIVFFLIVFRDESRKKFFIAILLIANKILFWNLGCSLFSCIILAFENAATNGQLTSIPLKTEHLISAAAYLMTALALNIWKKKLVTVLDNKLKRWYSIVSIPLIFIIVIVDIVNWGASNGIMVVSDATGAKYWNIFYNQIFSHIAICLLTMLGILIVAGFILGMNKIYIEQKQKEQYFSQIQFYEMLNEQYLQMERLRHDMKNHVLALHGLMEKNQLKKLGNYLDSMLENGNITASEEVTGNPVIDALLYHKRKLAKQQNIHWESDVQIPKNCSIDEFDLCVLIGNSLDNALHACKERMDKEDNFISIQFHKIKKCLLLVVKNKTSINDIKEIKQGIGFLNMNETVKKYHGIINTTVKNNVFEISILLPMDSDAHNMKQTLCNKSLTQTNFIDEK